MSAFMRRTGSLVAAAALLAVSTPVWASAPAARNAPAAAPAVQAAGIGEDDFLDGLVGGGGHGGSFSKAVAADGKLTRA